MARWRSLGVESAGLEPGPEAAPSAAAIASDGESHSKAGEAEGVPAALIVGAIALLVVLVSLPRFRAHVLRANRIDAPVTLDILGAYVFSEEWQRARTEDGAPDSLFAVIESEERLRHRFPDARRFEGPDGETILLHHGYLFGTGILIDGALRHPALVAWPSEYGRTGDAAFVKTGSGRTYGHDNRGLWSGSGNPLIEADLSDEGWRSR